MDLTDAQWAFLEPQFRPKRRKDGRGRPWQDTRAVLNGVLWVLRTGAPWHDLPARYPPYQTCHRRFQQWQRSGLLTRLLQTLAEDLRDRGKLDLSEAFIDASFSSAKKGALVSALQNAAKAAKSWQSQTAMVFLSPCTWPALRRMKPHSSNPRSQRRFLRETPERLIGDKAYDSDPLDQRVQRTFRRAIDRAAQAGTGADPSHKTAAPCVATVVAGKSSVCLLGSIIIVASSFAGNTTQRISSGWFSLLAL